MPVKHSPDWLRELLSQVLLILNAEESEPGGAKGELTGQLVVFSCPKCGGALDVDGSDRILECRYCGSKVYLPDDLWLRLHPAKTVQRWFLGIAPPKAPRTKKRRKSKSGCSQKKR